MTSRKPWLAALAVCFASLAGAAAAAEIRINNLDIGTGSGLDDHTAAAAVGGNPGKTRGEQARIVFEFAASLWGSVLKSRAPIVVDASFQKLACTATGGVLGSAGAVNVARFTPGLDNPPGASVGVMYHIALFNALAGVDAIPGQADIRARFNGAIGTPGCLEGTQWYFGLDGNTPAGQSNFLNVVLHEMSHGLGFSGFSDLTTGMPLTDGDGKVIPDIYSLYVYDNATRKRWYDMSDAERMRAAVNEGHLVYAGPHVRADAPLALSPRDALVVTAPAAVAGVYRFGWASFSPKPSPANFNGAVVRAVTGADAQACAAFDNAAAVAGRISLVDRGGCNYAVKARFAQAAGATAVVVVDKPDDPVPVLPPADDAGTPIAIPLVQISQDAGHALLAHADGLSMALRILPAGTDPSGNVLLYAPGTLRVGSSFAHFDVSLSPNALMEWQESPDLKGHLDLDLTPSLFQDEGWRLNAGGQLLGLCDTGVPAWMRGGAIVGANLAATAKMLAGTSASAGSYAQAMRAHASALARAELLSAAQATSLNRCLSDAEIARQYGSWRQGGSGDPVFFELDSGVVLPDQAGAAGSERLYLLSVPPGARALNIRSFGGTGDVSLIVRSGNEPTPSDYSYRSVHAGNNESVSVGRPAAGSYFIKLVGVKPYAGVTVQASYGM